MGRDAAAEAAFSEFAAASRSRLRSTAYLLCGDWERASDHVQEGLIRVYVAWPRLVRHGGELSYARKAVVSAGRPTDWLPMSAMTKASQSNISGLASTKSSR